MRGYESLYYKYDVLRVGVCKSTIYDVLHLGWMVEQCGPLASNRQFSMERYIRNIRYHLHAKYLTSESLIENVKGGRACHVVFQDTFWYKR